MLYAASATARFGSDRIGSIVCPPVVTEAERSGPNRFEWNAVQCSGNVELLERSRVESGERSGTERNGVEAEVQRNGVESNRIESNGMESSGSILEGRVLFLQLGVGVGEH